MEVKISALENMVCLYGEKEPSSNVIFELERFSNPIRDRSSLK